MPAPSAGMTGQKFTPSLAWLSRRRRIITARHGRTMCAHAIRHLCGLAMAERGRELALEKFDERILLRSDLHQDDVIEACRHIALDRLQMMLRRRAAADELGDGLGRNVL